MSLALLYDVHGNLPALEAVLADADEAGATGFVLGGDYALFGGWPAETVDRLEALPGAVWIRGNGERWTADPGDAPDAELIQRGTRWCAERLGEGRTRALAELPEQTVRDGVRYCHGSPVSDVRSFLPEPAEDERELLAGIADRRLVFGHTHLPFRRRAVTGEVELVNPGSVGMPLDGDTRAAYAIVRDDGEVEHRRVPYDVEAAVAAVRAIGDWAEPAALRIERARFES